MKFRWKNDKTRLFHSKQSILITRDVSAHQVAAILTVSLLLMHSLVSRWYTQLNTGAEATISAVEKWIHSFGIPQSIVHDRGTFIYTDFINWTKELGITLRRRTAHSLWTNGKIETQNQHIARYWRNFSNDAANNCSSLAPKFAFAHYQVSTTQLEGHPTKLFLVPNPKF